jgi:hypothetical protein
MPGLGKSGTSRIRDFRWSILFLVLSFDFRFVQLALGLWSWDFATRTCRLGETLRAEILEFQIPKAKDRKPKAKYRRQRSILKLEYVPVGSRFISSI